MKIKRGERRWLDDIKEYSNQNSGKLTALFALIVIIGAWAIISYAIYTGVINIRDTRLDALQAECQTVYAQLQGDISDLDRDILINRLGALDAELIKRFSSGCQLEGK